MQDTVTDKGTDVFLYQLPAEHLLGLWKLDSKVSQLVWDWTLYVL